MIRTLWHWMVALALVWFLPIEIGWAADWGDLTGRILLDGEPPVLAPLVKQGAVVRGGAGPVPDESLVIDAKSRGIANVFVWVRTRPAQIHLDGVEPPKTPVKIEQAGCRYVPHAAIVRVGQPVEVKNADPLPHNVRVDLQKNPPTNLIVQPAANPIAIGPFLQAEPVPVGVVCDIHPWMRGWLMIVDHPYVAITDKEGRFMIENLPAGEHEVRIWHERTGFLSRGQRFAITTAEVTELPTLRVPVARFFPEP
jgi:hypothetical protein